MAIDPATIKAQLEDIEQKALEINSPATIQVVNDLCAILKRMVFHLATVEENVDALIEAGEDDE